MCIVELADQIVILLNVLSSLSERPSARRREKELSSVSSFSEDEGVSEPCQAATEYSLQEQQNSSSCTPTHHLRHCPMSNQTTTNPMFLEAGFDTKCLQRNFSLPSPVRRTSLTTAERSHSWDQSCHTAQASTHNPPHTATYTCPQIPYYTAQIPPFAKSAISLPQRNILSSKGAFANPTLFGKEGVEATLSSAKAKPQVSAALSQEDSLQHFYQSRDHTAKLEEIESPKSISAAIKSKVMGFLQRSFSPSRSSNSSSAEGHSDFSGRSKVKDEEYRKLVEYIMKEEAELLHCERPALEHTVSAPESSEVFAVREFPMSSQVLTRRKSRSLDEPPVIPPPRVRRKSKSLDESPCIEISGDSNESGEDNSSPGLQSQDTENKSIYHFNEKILEAEQSCDSGNQSDSGGQEGVLTEEQHTTNVFPAHVRNDSGTVVEDKEHKESKDEVKEQSDNESDESSSESDFEDDVRVENVDTKELVDEVYQEDLPKDKNVSPDARTVEKSSGSSAWAARRSSLQLIHKKASPVTSNGSCSDKSSVETDCDEWARTTEAVIRSMQNQMLRRQSAIEDFSADFDRFTTSSSGDSRLGQLTYEDINNGASPHSPPLPARRGSEASTISSDGVSVAESPSDFEESDVWKSKSNSPTENGSPVKEYSLPSSSIIGNGTNNSSSSSSSPSSSSQSSPGEHPAYHRFYHVFREGELIDLIERHVDNLHILTCYYDHANWCVVAEKVQVWRI